MKAFGMLLLALLMCVTFALADDAELLKVLPGDWRITAFDETQADDESPKEIELAVLSLTEDGGMTLRCHGANGADAYTATGEWTFRLITVEEPEGGLWDRLTLTFTATDNPLYAGQDYRVECLYYVYSEAWVEDDTLNTWLIMYDGDATGVPPIQEITGELGTAAIHREQGPNMRIANCKEWVSLRESRSMSAKRLAKVPLGAEVLALGEADAKGFVWCTYQDEYGYILEQYLTPVE